MKECFIKIYGLKLKNNDGVFYVGSTKLELEKRLKRHKIEIKSNTKTNEQLKFFSTVDIDDIEIILLEGDIPENERLEKEDIWYHKLLENNVLINSKKPSATWAQTNKRVPIGEKQYNSKLNETKVKQIIQLYKFTKMSVVEIAKLYNVVWQTISRIIDGENWKHITNGEKIYSMYPKRITQGGKFIKDKRSGRKLKNNDVLEIISKHKNGVSKRQLSREYNTSRSVINGILDKTQYVDVTKEIEM